MVEAPAPRAFIQGQNRVRRQRAKTHRRDIEHAGFVRLRAGRAADLDAKVMAGDLRRRDRVVDPLIVRLIDIELRAERPFVRNALGALIDDRTLRARKGQFFSVGLDEVLADLRADVFEEEAQVSQHWIVAPYRLDALRVVDVANQGQSGKPQRRPQPPR